MTTQSGLITFDERTSDAAEILSIWRSTSQKAGSFVSMAYPTWEFVFSQVSGKVGVSLRGPETTATHAELPADGLWLGIRFRTGAVLSGVNHAALRNRTISLEMIDDAHFHLCGKTYEVPTFGNADCFVAQLVKSGLLKPDNHVRSAINSESAMGTNIRTIQRRFVSATGLSQQTIETIERARRAAAMLRAGQTINDTIEAAGYCDQSHLTRSLTRLIGVSPAALTRVDGRPQLSFLSSF